MQIKTIPLEVIQLAVEATSDHNDGWTKADALEKLKQICEYCERIVKAANEAQRS